jgi:imidazolonepropionase
MLAADLVFRSIGQLVTMVEDDRGLSESRVGARSQGALACEDGAVVWAGPDSELAAAVQPTATATIINVGDRVLMPGFIDPHTHLVFDGSRHLEFALRLAGADYLEILASGGGIHNTVRLTRQATRESLLQSASKRLETLLAFGVTTCEIKSGYGLDTENELKILEVVRSLAAAHPQKLVPTFLGAHVFPVEYKDRHDAYVDLVCEEMIPAVTSAGLAQMCDVFLDQGVFDREQARRILTTAAERGLRTRLHAGQFTDLGGPELAAELGATSADHMEHFSERGARAMAEAGVVACLLPGAALSLGMSYPDGRKLREAGVEIALSTDSNPGTSRTENLPLMVTLAVTAMRLSVEDALRGITCTAARALGLGDGRGTLAPGAPADLVILDVPDYRSIAYHFGVNHVREVFIDGRRVLG